MINIVLFEPEIPNNTGNIVRTCAATGAVLHVIEPCGFSWEDKYLKRSGLDYWEISDVRRYENIYDFLKKNFGYEGEENMDKAVKNASEKAGIQTLFSSTKGSIVHSEINFERDCFIFFGRETRGLPESLLKENYDKTFRIPMRANARSLNLANSVAIVVYEYLRRFGYEDLKTKGELTGRDEGR